MVPGFGIGTGVGFAVMFSAKSSYKRASNQTVKVYDYVSDSDVSISPDVKMPIQEQVLVVASGAVLGGIVGFFIKSGWKTIYPNKTSFIRSVKIEIQLLITSCYKQLGLSFVL